MEKSVIIIGGGVAGLTAGKLLHASKWKVTLLEGSNEIGGRATNQEEIGGTVAELGAQCIYGHKSVVENFIANLNLEDNKEYFGEIGPDDDVYIVNSFHFGESGILAPIYNQELVKLVKLIRAEVGTQGTLDAGDIQRISWKNFDAFECEGIDKSVLKSCVKWLLQFWEIFEPPEAWHLEGTAGEERCVIPWKLPGGSKSFIKCLLDIPQNAKLTETGLKPYSPWIYCNKRVIRISIKSNESVTVFCSDGSEHMANAVICTLPLGVLKSKSVVFEPPLPAPKLRAIESLEMAVFNFIYLEFESGNWWPDGNFGLNFIHQDSNADEGVLDEDEFGIPKWCKSILAFTQISTATTGNFVIQGFLSGTPAKLIEVATEDYLIRSLHALLKNALCKSVPPPKRVVFSAWGSREMARGSFSTSSKSYDEAKDWRIELGKADFGNPPRLHFAGEAMSVKYPGSLQGAYYQGLNAANELNSNT